MKIKSHSKLWMYFTGIVFTIVLGVLLCITAVWYLLYEIGYIDIDPWNRHFPIIILTFASVLVGVGIALFVGKLIIRPIQNISDAFDALSKGNFDVRVSTDERITEIREMSGKFNAMAYDLSHVETLRNDFVVSVSHEFKTPLAAVSGYATLLQNPYLSREHHDKYVEIILENIDRLTKLSGDVLSLSKLENRETVPQKTEFRLDEQIRKQILLLEEKWSTKNIEFDMDLPKTMYYGSEGLLAQIWGNILDNAIKASPTGGEIYVDIRQTGSAISVAITDHGLGMSEDVQKHIFEKFYQGDPSRKAEGNGLGLALVKRILELCGGDISVESEQGKGSTFIVSLP